MRKIFFTCINILIMQCGFCFAQNDSIVRIQVDSLVIEGSLKGVKNLSSRPLALIISGSGNTDRNGNGPYMKNNSLKMLSESLYENGISSIRYDKRGVGKSYIKGLKEEDLTIENFIEDAQGWLQFIKKKIRPSEIIVIGHSEGTLIGMMAARKRHADKFISIAGLGRKPSEVLKEQLSTQPEYIQKPSFSIIDSLENGSLVKKVPDELNSLFRVSVQPFLISLLRINPLVEIKKLKIPILIIQGDNDIQIGAQDADNLHNAYPNSRKIIINGMNHILKNSSKDRNENILTYNLPDKPLNNQLIKEIIDFIKN